MYYIILVAVVAFELFVILHDSSDGVGYNKKGESGRSAAILPPELVKHAKAKATAAEAEKGVSRSYLYYLDYYADLRADLMETEVTGMRRW